MLKDRKYDGRKEILFVSVAWSSEVSKKDRTWTISPGLPVKSRVCPLFLQERKLMNWLAENELPCTEKVCEELCRCFILLQTLPCFLIVFTYKILFFMAWHRKRCLLYWQLKARFDQLISRLKISWIKFLKMGLSLSKHIVLMINFYLFKNLTKDQISLFMADLNPSLFCPAKLQAYLWKLFWELYFPTLGNICQIRKFQLLLLNLLGNSWIPW